MLSGFRFLMLGGTLFFPVAALAAEPAPAPVSSDLARAEELYNNGALLYEEGNYQGAILAFQSAFDISHEPALYYNIANCYERMGKFVEARDALNLYRAVAPADERERLDRRLANLEERIAQQQSQPAQVTPAPAPATTTTPQPAGNPLKWVLVGGGLALGAGGGTMITVGYLDSHDARSAGDKERYTVDRTVNMVGYGVAGAGVAALVVGLVIPNQSPVSLAPVPVDGGVEMVATVLWPVRSFQ